MKERDLQNVLDNLNDALFIVDLQGNYIEANRVACERLGFSREELLNMSVFDLDDVKSGLLAQERIESIIRNKQAVLEAVHVSKDGKNIPVELHTKLIDYDGKQAILSVARDITERKNIEDALNHYTVELELKSIEMEELYRHLDEEIDKARHIHESIVAKDLPSIEGVSIATHYQPAKKLGGDFFDVITVDKLLVMYLSDVSGHGLDGAMMSLFVKNTISSYIALSPKENITPEKMLRFLDKQYRKMEYPDDYFISIFLCILDIDSHRLTYTGMGFQSLPMVHLGNGENIQLECVGLPITAAVPAEILNFEEESILLPVGTTMLISSDGLPEQSVGGELYEARLKRVFTENSSCIPPNGLVELVNYDFFKFNHDHNEGSDDVTFLVFQLQPNNIEHQLVLESKFDEIVRFHQWLFSVFTNEEEVDLIFSCMQELVANAIEHGNQLNPEKKVVANIMVCNQQVFASVEDEGNGFNWELKCSTPLDLSGECERGRGIAMTGMFSDKLFYNIKGNKAYLVIKRQLQSGNEPIILNL